MSRAVDHRHARLGIALLSAWAAFQETLDCLQLERVDMEAARNAAIGALSEAGIAAPALDAKPFEWLLALDEYGQIVLGYCEDCDRPKTQADLSTGADEDGIWVCQACLDAGRVQLEPTEGGA